MARVAAAVLVSPDTHTGQTYDITGPTTISFRELAQAFMAARGDAGQLCRPGRQRRSCNCPRIRHAQMASARMG
jgi:uncharacterized protein YbjT (DUF2867 family)